MIVDLGEDEDKIEIKDGGTGAALGQSNWSGERCRQFDSKYLCMSA